eukprot:TRINITY_DN75485_c0_g1_i1.p1 TRINITY_DN75485_c0_g1~~TRINITY_DN75485_c0_g1_i1.p1  ORF type:complete len:673 (-),score=148.26 TRINITY_DN75485_c0_g1_i1:258-2276(-)
MDFDLAKKHSKEVEQRRREAKRKLEQQKRDEEQQRVMEHEYRERELVRLRQEQEEKARAEQEALLNDGVKYTTRLRPYPSSRTDDKLELPPSALEELERQGAIERGTLLTFAVCLPGSGSVRPGSEPSSSSAGSTHAGVAEFTAEEGTVGVPPRVALCLTKGSGLDRLDAVGQVDIRYVRLPRCAKSRVKLQPRGEGFHAGGAKTISMDLEHVLLETLRGHTALTQGDWLPIRHQGQTYELMVRELEPETELTLIDTDLTVEVLPSEQTEADLRAEEERQAREEAAAREAERQEELRLERCRLRASQLQPEPEPGPDVVQLLVRLPAGGRLSRRFSRTETLEQVLVWVESEPDALVQAGEFRVVQKWPGHCRELGPAEAGETLGSLKFARQEALFLQRLSDAAAEEEEVPAAAAAETPVNIPASEPSAANANDAWSQAEEQAHAVLDRRLEGQGTPTAAASREPELAEIRGQELVGVFERLVALGMEPPKAAQASKRFAAQLKELGDMGFENWLEAVELLERYNGRLLRVVNLLTERIAEGSLEPPAPSPAPPPPPPAAAVSAPAPSPAPAPKAAPIDKERVAAKFKELLAGGMAPNDAAAKAIQLVREEMAQAKAAESPAVTGPSEVGSSEFEERLRELASMGFTDEGQNLALLTKYAGRMERVIEALCAG